MKKCDECGTIDSSFDETMGEHICNECGLVIVTEMFEETVMPIGRTGDLTHSADRGHLGSVITGEGSYKFNRFKKGVVPQHIQKALMHCNMVLANFSPSDSLKERVEKIYMEAHRKSVFGQSSYEDRATAIVYYALKERGTPMPLKKVTQEFEVKPKRVRRLIRRLNSLFRNQINYTEVNPAYMMEYNVLQITKDRLYLQQCLEVLARFENIVSNSNYTKTKSYYSSICWITSNVFERSEPNRNQISEATGIHTSCIHATTRSLLALIGKTLVTQLKGKDVNKIGETDV